MAASFTLKRKTGDSLVNESDALYLSDGEYYVQFSTLDSAQHDAGNYPVGRPSDSSTAYSIECALVLKMDTPPDNQVDNLRFWSSGNDPDTGIYMYIGTSSGTFTPSDSESAIATTNATEFTSQGDSMLWSNVAMTQTNDLSDILVMQIRVDSSASTGNKTTEGMVYHYSYDES